jgi:hypothetical protein
MGNPMFLGKNIVESFVILDYRGGQTFLLTGRIQKIISAKGRTYKVLIIFLSKKIPNQGVFSQNCD